MKTIRIERDTDILVVGGQNITKTDKVFVKITDKQYEKLVKLDSIFSWEEFFYRAARLITKDNGLNSAPVKEKAENLLYNYDDFNSDYARIIF